MTRVAPACLVDTVMESALAYELQAEELYVSLG